MLIPKTNNLPRVVNTSERRKIFDKKSAVNSRFWSSLVRMKQMIEEFARARYLPYKKRMRFRKRMQANLQQMGLDFSAARKLECELNEYDELQRVRYSKISKR